MKTEINLTTSWQQVTTSGPASVFVVREGIGSVLANYEASDAAAYTLDNLHPEDVLQVRGLGALFLRATGANWVVIVETL